MRFLDEGQHVFERHVALDGMRRGEDVAAGPAASQQVAGFGADVGDALLGQGDLRGESAPE